MKMIISKASTIMDIIHFQTKDLSACTFIQWKNVSHLVLHDYIRDIVPYDTALKINDHLTTSELWNYID